MWTQVSIMKEQDLKDSDFRKGERKHARVWKLQGRPPEAGFGRVSRSFRSGHGQGQGGRPGASQAGNRERLAAGPGVQNQECVPCPQRPLLTCGSHGEREGKQGSGVHGPTVLPGNREDRMQRPRSHKLPEPLHVWGRPFSILTVPVSPLNWLSPA